ncbi:MAG TPA: NAD-glutamate dehydrogenase, partial [Streptomyces sp.]|nr:NAD-glutamate dehydrogenase [Streptomyces sp.]
MQTKLDEAKAELLERAARVAGSDPAVGHPPGLDAENLGLYLQRYYLHTAPEDLAGRDATDVYGAAISHHRLAQERPQGTANVRVHSPSADRDGWSSPHTVVEVVTDDMPFLVASVTNELIRQGHDIHLVVHPQVVVRRDVTGTLLQVLDAGRDPRLPSDGDTAVRPEIPQDAVVESWIHVEIDRETESDVLEQITADLLRVLSDVREAVEDWQKMRSAALRIADELPGEPIADEVSDKEVEEARELLRWLAADHFTFLGYREYELTSETTDGAEELLLTAVPGTGLGILRSDPQHTAADSRENPASPSFGRLPADVRARAREPRLLVLTKANSRATVHRTSYLDYIGVKKFDEAGNVVGERRFLGLFSSVAYTESVRRVPVIRRKVDEVIAAAGFTPDSHGGRDLLRILETYPRDELFQVPADELRDVVTSVLYLQERRDLRLYLRQDDYGRYYSALVYLPRDRYTTAVRLRLTDILTEELGGTSADFTAWSTESVLARLHFVIRVPQGTEPARQTDADVERIQARLAEAARSWADGFSEELTAEYGEEEATPLAHRYTGAFPQGYKADFAPHTAVTDLKYIQRLESGEDADGFSLNLYEPADAASGERRLKIYRTGEPVSLSTVLPILQAQGIEVTDERPYELRCTESSPAWIYDFGLRLPESQTQKLDDDARERFQDAFAAVW